VVEPTDFARALDADPIARAAHARLPDGRKREHVRAIESAKKPETRIRRIAQLQLRAERVHEPFAPARIQQPPVKLVDLELITDPELRPARPVVRFVECRIAALRSTCARSLADLTRHPPASSRALSAKPALAAELRLDHARPPG
jgi:Bacteriocin-protection, YdeI or OmpD-Associated